MSLAVRRFGTIALLVALLSAALTTWLVRQVTTPTYTAEGTYIVPVAVPNAPGFTPPPGPPRPTSPGDAQVLAQQYAVVLGEDQVLLGEALTGPTQMSVTDLGKAISAVSVPRSAAIHVAFTAERKAAVVAYFNTMRGILSQPDTVPSPTSYLPAGNLRVLRMPESITTQRGLAPVAPYIGIGVGLLLGVAVLAVGWGSHLISRASSRRAM